MGTAHHIGRLGFAVFIAPPGSAPKHHADEMASTAAVNGRDIFNSNAPAGK